MISTLLRTLKLSRSAKSLTRDKVKAHIKLQHRSNAIHICAFSIAECEWLLKEYSLLAASYLFLPYLPGMCGCVLLQHFPGGSAAQIQHYTGPVTEITGTDWNVLC